MSDYINFLQRKKLEAAPVGFDVPSRALVPALFDFQRDIVRWALKQGRAAVFADCGVGKGPISLEFARLTARHTGKPSLIVAPLAVAAQFEDEATKFCIGLTRCRTQAEVQPGVNVTNYEMLSHFDAEAFGAVVLDESGILKNYTGTTKRMVTEMFSRTPYRLCCTATPAPNDHLELGNHAEFLGVLSSHEMIARWFINSDQAGVYRLKRHGAADFWRWVASWAVSVRTPADLGYPAKGYVLPPLQMHRVIVPVDLTTNREDRLFRSPDLSATGLHAEMRLTAPARADAVAALVNPSAGSWLVWCNTDYEADALMARIPDAVEVRGSMAETVKEQRLNDFKAGRIRVLVTKPRIAGYGLNLQGCHNTAFVGLSYSFEQFYQAIRRVYRFGQTKPVNAYVVAAETEDALVSAIERKMAAFEDQRRGMLAASRLAHTRQERRVAYRPSTVMHVPAWLTSLEYAA